MPLDDNGVSLIPFTGATHPLKVEVTDLEMPEGLTVAEMLAIAQPDPVLLRDAVVFIGDHEIKREYWHVVRPKRGAKVTARIVPYMRGGGGGGGKNPLRTILTIAVIAAAFFLGPALGAALGIEGTIAIAGIEIGLAGAVGGAIISVAGNLLINAIAPVKPPSLGNLSGAGVTTGVQESPSLFLEGGRNEARPFGTVPSVLGFFRFRPPLGASTVTEVLGDKNQLRMLLVPGLGELELSDWRIGNTPLENFSDFELETRPGTDADAALTLYTNQIKQEEFSIALTQEAGFQQLTSDLDADELSVDITFPRGLVTFSGSGSRGNRSVVVELEFRKVGEVDWNPLPAEFTATFDSSAVSGKEITLKGAQSSVLREGVRWKTGERAQYEVRMRRTTSDTTSTQIFDLTFWATLRTFTNEDPIQLASPPLAKAALTIRATDQLNGLLDTLSVLAKSVALDWDSGTSTWIKRATNNPASLFRHVLQGPGKAEPVSDSQIDLVKLQEWHEFCDTNGFTFNMVRDFVSSVMEMLTDICAAGRAGLDVVDGKWSVVIDQPISVVTTHITPHNSRNFELERGFLELPHAWRVRFPNELKDYDQDERIVYNDGYDATNSTVFQAIEFAGVTNPDHIWKQARYSGGVTVQRPERWKVTQDYEVMLAKRGKRIKVTQDVMLAGQGSGRIKTATLDGSNNITSFTVDQDFTMVSGKSYGVVIRRNVDGDVSISVPVNTAPGTTNTFTPTTPILAASSVGIGDLLGFGEFGKETEDGLVLVNEPDSDFAGKLTIVPYREEVFQADQGTIPPFVSNIGEQVFLPAVEIIETVTDESVLDQGVGDTTLVRAQFNVAPIDEFEGAVLEAQQRPTGSNLGYLNSEIVARNEHSIRVGGVATGETWDFRLRWNRSEQNLPGPWTPVPNVLIIGRSTNPDPLKNPTIAVFGGQALIRWEQADNLDVRFGGQVIFRHTNETGSPSWSNSTSIGQAAQARSLFATLPLKPGTYIARVIDSDGNRSDPVFLQTKQADLLEFANVNTINEHALFAGTHSSTIGAEGQLKLVNLQNIDDYPDLDSITGQWDSIGGIALSGTYGFAAGFDFGTVRRIRLTSRIDALSVNTSVLFDDILTNIDDLEDFDGTDQAEADIQVWIRLTDDDPASSPTWTDWQKLDSTVVEARGVDAEARLFTNSSDFNIVCTELGIDAEEVV